MKYVKSIGLAILMSIVSSTFVHAGVYTSDQVIQSAEFNVNRQQVVNMLDAADVQAQLIALGVSKADALARVNAMTPAEMSELNAQLNDAPAGGIVGTVVTVLVVIAVLDLLGITDVYPFIRPI